MWASHCAVRKPSARPNHLCSSHQKSTVHTNSRSTAPPLMVQQGVAPPMQSAGPWFRSGIPLSPFSSLEETHTSKRFCLLCFPSFVNPRKGQTEFTSLNVFHSHWRCEGRLSNKQIAPIWSLQPFPCQSSSHPLQQGCSLPRSPLTCHRNYYVLCCPNLTEYRVDAFCVDHLRQLHVSVISFLHNWPCDVWLC